MKRLGDDGGSARAQRLDRAGDRAVRRQREGRNGRTASARLQDHAGALPGAFKNLFDWTVGDDRPGSIYEKPVGWVNASPRGAPHAHESLRRVLGYLHAQIVEDACVHIPVTADLLEEGLIADPAVRDRLAALLAALGAPGLDATCAYAAVALAGDRRLDVFHRSSGLDVRESRFGADRCLAGSVMRVPTLVLNRGDDLVMMVAWEYGEYCWEAILDAGETIGITRASVVAAEAPQEQQQEQEQTA